MAEFLESVWKGIYPVFFLFAVYGIVLRVKAREWTAFDTLLIGMFAVFEISTALLPWIFYGTLTISHRYLLIGVPLYFPFAAIGFLAAWKFSGRGRVWKYGVCVLLAVLAASTLWNIYSPAVKEYTSRKKSAERKLSFAAAEWIRRDWAGRRLPRISQMKCDEYQSGKRPLIDSEFQRIGYLSGGQQLPEFLKTSGVRPDYTVSSRRQGKDAPAPEHILTLNGYKWFIYRNFKVKNVP